MPKPFQYLTLVRNGVVKFNDDALGRTVSQTGSKAGIDINVLSYRFSTKPMELELATANTTLVPPPVSSGLYYYGYRFYSPNLGRWISRDPIREKGGRNLYNFVGNDGVDQWDELGLIWEEIASLSFSGTLSPAIIYLNAGVRGTLYKDSESCCKKISGVANISYGVGFNSNWSANINLFGFRAQASVSGKVSLSEIRHKIDISIIFDCPNSDTGSSTTIDLIDANLGFSAELGFSASLKLGNFSKKIYETSIKGQFNGAVKSWMVIEKSKVHIFGSLQGHLGADVMLNGVSRFYHDDLAELGLIQGEIASFDLP